MDANADKPITKRYSNGLMCRISYDEYENEVQLGLHACRLYGKPTRRYFDENGEELPYSLYTRNLQQQQDRILKYRETHKVNPGMPYNNTKEADFYGGFFSSLYFILMVIIAIGFALVANGGWVVGATVLVIGVYVKGRQNAACAAEFNARDEQILQKKWKLKDIEKGEQENK